METTWSGSNLIYLPAEGLKPPIYCIASPKQHALWMYVYIYTYIYGMYFLIKFGCGFYFLFVFLKKHGENDQDLGASSSERLFWEKFDTT